MSKEINLLPLTRRRALMRRFTQRQLLRFSKSVALALIVITVGGVAAIVFLQVAGSTLFEPVGRELDDAVVSFRVEKKSIEDQNRLAKEMRAVHEERLVWSELFADVLSTLPPGTRLTDIAGTLEARRLELRGVATARSALVVMEEKLRAMPWAKEVQAPHSNLLNRENPEFTFFVTL